MKLKMRQIALLVASLSTSAVSMAAAVTVEQIDTAREAGTLQQAWITGASAPTRTVYEGWVRGCDADTNTIFSSQGGTAVVPGSIGNYSAYACTRGGVVSVLYHTLDGGSLNAYTPHTVGTVLGRVKYVGDGNGCEATPLNYEDAVNPLNNAVVYKGCDQIGGGVPATGATTESNTTNAAAIATDPNAPALPLGGYSDVEAALFPEAIGGGDVSSRGAESDVGVGQVFGLAVSIPLYRALQVQQQLTQDDEPANAPNITSGQYTNLIRAGGLFSWDGLLPGNTSRVNIARRVDTSGTQASSNAFFLKNPCSAGLNQQLNPTTPAQNVPGVYNLVLNSGSGNVQTMLTNASNSSDANAQFAIGVLSAENNWRTASTASAGYRYLKIDGVHPETGDTDRARRTAANGDYKFHMELKQFIRADYDGVPPKTPFETAVLNEITEELKNPPANSCAVFPRGLTLNPLNFSSCTRAEVAKMTNGGQNCAAPTQFF
jgi:hypothetical protein